MVVFVFTIRRRQRSRANGRGGRDGGERDGGTSGLTKKRAVYSEQTSQKLVLLADKRCSESRVQALGAAVRKGRVERRGVKLSSATAGL
jgi:hypothetical protein